MSTTSRRWSSQDDFFCWQMLAIKKKASEGTLWFIRFLFSSLLCRSLCSHIYKTFTARKTVQKKLTGEQEWMEKKIWIESLSGERGKRFFYARSLHYGREDDNEWFCGEKRGSWKSGESVNSHIPPQINLKNMLPLFTSLVQIQWHSLTRINFNLLSDSGLSAGVSFWLLDRWLLCFLIGASSEIPQQRNPTRNQFENNLRRAVEFKLHFYYEKSLLFCCWWRVVMTMRDVMCVWKYFCERKSVYISEGFHVN